MEKNMHLYSGAPIDEKKLEISAAQYFFDNVQKHGTKIAMINANTSEELTFKKIFKDSCKLAISLKKFNLTINDRVAVFSENNLFYGIIALSNIFLGTTLCPLNSSYTKNELVHILSISKPKCIFVTPLTFLKIKEAMTDLIWSPRIFLIYGNVQNSLIPNIQKLISQISDTELKTFKLPEIDVRNHVIFIFCSSGTTGLPKCVMLTDRNILTYAHREQEDYIFLNDRNKKEIQSYLVITPFFHGHGFFSLVFDTLIHGRKAILLPRFEEHKFLRTIEKYRIPLLMLVPPLVVFLAKNSNVEKYDLTSVKYILSGAAPLSKETEIEVIKRFKNRVKIYCGYGLTETTMNIMITTKNIKSGSVGKLAPGVIGKVVPLENFESDESLRPNQVGELCFKGYTIMKGCFDNKEATNSIIDKNGWLHTGDVGFFDEDGFLYIVDRIKELIKYKGFQVPPVELESILLTNTNVKDAAVVGLPDEEAGELPFAFVVKQPGSTITKCEIIKYVNERVSPQQYLRGGVEFVNEIPKTPSGKILRRKLTTLLKSKL